jgi:hypothetical protein
MHLHKHLFSGISGHYPSLHGLQNLARLRMPSIAVKSTQVCVARGDNHPACSSSACTYLLFIDHYLFIHIFIYKYFFISFYIPEIIFPRNTQFSMRISSFKGEHFISFKKIHLHIYTQI